MKQGREEPFERGDRHFGTRLWDKSNVGGKGRLARNTEKWIELERKEHGGRWCRGAREITRESRCECEDTMGKGSWFAIIRDRANPTKSAVTCFVLQIRYVTAYYRNTKTPS